MIFRKEKKLPINLNYLIDTLVDINCVTLKKDLFPFHCKSNKKCHSFLQKT